MLFIVQIILTVIAWRGGRGVSALLPMGAAVAAGLALGFGGATFDTLGGFGAFLVADLLATIWLIVLIKGNKANALAA